VDIVAVGEPLVELVAEEPGHLGEVTTFSRGWGGDTSTVVVAAARLGASAGYVTRVGADEFGRSFVSLWEREGVDASRITVDRGRATGVYFVGYDASDGGHRFTYYRRGSAASRLGPQDLDPDYLGSSRVVHTSGITQVLSSSCRAAAEAAMRLARARGVTVSYDANVRPGLASRRSLLEVFEASLPSVDIVFASDEDLTHLYGRTEADPLVYRFLDLGPSIVVVKRGSAGARVVSREGGTADVPGLQVAAVDATGAGDAFDAGFLVSWLAGGSITDACRFANAVGALTSCGRGAMASVPTREQVERFLLERAAAGIPEEVDLGPEGPPGP
jgi:2-dehydro-3-deoxygluconokinase